MLRAIAMTAVLLTFAKASSALPAFAPAPAPPTTSAELPSALADVGIDEHLGDALPRDVTFRDHTGSTVTLDAFFDRKRPIVVSLMYHRCPMLCSVVLDGLTRALQEVPWSVGREFDVVTISIDPRDTLDAAARKRRQILERYGRAEADRGWHFLVGDEASIRRVAGALGFRYRWDAEQQQYAHPAAIFLLTPEGKIARYLYGVDFASRDLRLALLEASEGRVVSTVERLLLFCYHYDAAGRRYAVTVSRVLRVAGAVLFGVLVVALTVLWRKDLRADRIASRDPPTSKRDTAEVKQSPS